MLRVVVDTNVLVEGQKDPNSYPVRIMRLALAGELVPLVSPRTQREHDRLLERLVMDQEYQQLVERFFEQAERIETSSDLRGATDDPEDDKFLELAKDGDADYVITGDRHLLDLEQLSSTEITTPERFWNTYQEVAGTPVLR
ncbi:MAG: putative toxin-antitoxin system toxin component, PIN family [Parcubacteria group bacterium]